jgi:hypothetical protein
MTDPRVDVSLWLVAFLDILGYRKILEGFDAEFVPAGDDDENAERFSSHFLKAVRLRRRLNERLLELSKELVPSNWNELPSESQQQFLALTKTDIVPSTGPDHVVLVCSLSGKGNHMLGVARIVTATAGACLIQLALGHDEPEDTRPLRGGIDIAPGVYLDPERHLYSPGLMRAYDLERKAKYPRILVGERVRKYLEVFSDSDSTRPSEEATTLLAQRTQQLFFVDMTDNSPVLVIDFFGEGYRRLSPSSATVEMAHKAWRYANSALSVAKASASYNNGNEKKSIVEKYEYLVAYMDTRRGLWGIP